MPLHFTRAFFFHILNRDVLIMDDALRRAFPQPERLAFHPGAATATATAAATDAATDAEAKDIQIFVKTSEGKTRVGRVRNGDTVKDVLVAAGVQVTEELMRNCYFYGSLPSRRDGITRKLDLDTPVVMMDDGHTIHQHVRAHPSPRPAFTHFFPLSPSHPQWENIPTTLLTYILETAASPSTTARCACVCKQWREVVYDNEDMLYVTPFLRATNEDLRKPEAVAHYWSPPPAKEDDASADDAPLETKGGNLRKFLKDVNFTHLPEFRARTWRGEEKQKITPDAVIQLHLSTIQKEQQQSLWLSQWHLAIISMARRGALRRHLMRDIFKAFLEFSSSSSLPNHALANRFGSIFDFDTEGGHFPQICRVCAHHSLDFLEGQSTSDNPQVLCSKGFALWHLVASQPCAERILPLGNESFLAYANRKKDAFQISVGDKTLSAANVKIELIKHAEEPDWLSELVSDFEWMLERAAEKVKSLGEDRPALSYRFAYFVESAFRYVASRVRYHQAVLAFLKEEEVEEKNDDDDDDGDCISRELVSIFSEPLVLDQGISGAFAWTVGIFQPNHVREVAYRLLMTSLREQCDDDHLMRQIARFVVSMLPRTHASWWRSLGDVVQNGWLWDEEEVFDVYDEAESFECAQSRLIHQLIKTGWDRLNHFVLIELLKGLDERFTTEERIKACGILMVVVRHSSTWIHVHLASFAPQLLSCLASPTSSMKLRCMVMKLLTIMLSINYQQSLYRIVAEKLDAAAGGHLALRISTSFLFSAKGRLVSQRRTDSAHDLKEQTKAATQLVLALSNYADESSLCAPTTGVLRLETPLSTTNFGIPTNGMKPLDVLWAKTRGVSKCKVRTMAREAIVDRYLAPDEYSMDAIFHQDAPRDMDTVTDIVCDVLCDVDEFNESGVASLLNDAPSFASGYLASLRSEYMTRQQMAAFRRQMKLVREERNALQAQVAQLQAQVTRLCTDGEMSLLPSGEGLRRSTVNDLD